MIPGILVLQGEEHVKNHTLFHALCDLVNALAALDAAMPPSRHQYALHALIHRFDAVLDLLVDWEQAPDWQRTSAMHGVQFVLAYPSAPCSAQHETWWQTITAAVRLLDERRRMVVLQGRVYGLLLLFEPLEKPSFIDQKAAFSESHDTSGKAVNLPVK